MKKEIIRVPVISDVMEKLGVPISPAVRANGFVFVSGVPPLDLSTGQIVRGDIERQTEASLNVVKATLEAAGSSLDKVVNVRVYIVNCAYFNRVNAVYRKFFPSNFPSRTFVTVGSWPLEFDIEIECVALA